MTFIREKLVAGDGSSGGKNGKLGIGKLGKQLVVVLRMSTKNGGGKEMSNRMENVAEPYCWRMIEPESNVIAAEDYFWRIVERDVEAFVHHGGPDRDMENRR